MTARIKSVEENSIASDLGLVSGDCIAAINANTAMEDLFDYEFEVMGESTITLTVLHANGQTEVIDIEKDPMDDLGIVFESPIFTPIKTCNNACPFCFIDQQPEGLRPTLYVKDDDYRLSYFCNTYITLTNLTRHDRERIEKLRPGPLYVSVHCTVPDVRAQLLVNPKAGTIMEELSWLASLEVPFHCQIVICPGINDGEAFRQSLTDLATLRPHCLSIAVVPVGLTQHRGDLPDLTTVTSEVANQVLKDIQAFQATIGDTEDAFIFASDEFYTLAGKPLPQYGDYGDFPQLDDGVGGARLLTEEFFQLENTLPKEITPPRNHIAVTGKMGEMVLRPIIQRLNQVEGLYIDLVTVQNKFWGNDVTVSGLVTGQDILNTLADQDLSNYTSILIPEIMLKSGETLFLDGLSIDDLTQQLDCPLHVVPDSTRAQPLLDILFNPVST